MSTRNIPNGNPISEFDCRPAALVKSELLPSPEIDYLARDFASFRRLMLDRLTAILPDWQERNPADLGMALVEVLAYAADQLSYYQESVATEAYLGTARQRISVRRHARLLDYIVHEGCNARVWVQFEVTGDVLLDRGTQVLTQVEELADQIRLDEKQFKGLASGFQVFETLHPAQLFAAHNKIYFQPASAEDPGSDLLSGSLQAELSGIFPDLKVGEVLIFEEEAEPESGGNPDQRHAVRLAKVTQHEAQNITAIEWQSQDALPFDLRTSKSVARGNIVLADCGQTLKSEVLPQITKGGDYRPRLLKSDLTFAVPYNPVQAHLQAATTMLAQDPRTALPAITLEINGETWTARGDLLSSDRFAHDFVVEVNNAGQACLRFGDGVRGKRPPVGAIPMATYRSGNGLHGNIGQESIKHVVTSNDRVAYVRNPLPARGGARPESIEHVRLHAPHAFRVQERCVTAADYVEAAQRHPEVDRAVAFLQWLGGWPTMFVALERKEGRPVDPAFRAELRAFLEPFRLVGCDLEICAPRYLPLDIALTVQVAPHSFQTTVNQALLEAFSDVDLPNGDRGFFHPDKLTFNQPVYLSQVIATAMRLPGVNRVEPVRFQQLGQPVRDELADGRIKVGPLEIARLDNDPNAPENGRIEFILEGGL